MQGVLVLAAFVVTLFLARPYGDGAIVALIVLLGIGMACTAGAPAVAFCLTSRQLL